MKKFIYLILFFLLASCGHSSWDHTSGNNTNLDFQLALNNLFNQAIKLGLKDHDLSAMVNVFKK